MPGYRFERNFVGPFALNGQSDNGNNIPGDFISVGNGFIRIYRAHFQGIFQTLSTAVCTPALAVVNTFVVPHPLTGSGVFLPLGTILCSGAAGTNQQGEVGVDFGDEGKLFPLNTGNTGEIGFCDATSGAAGTVLFGIMTVDYGYDLSPQTAPGVGPGPL